MECVSCHTTLTGSLDTYGPINEPLCWSCFSNPELRGDEVESLERRLEELDSDLEDAKLEVENCEEKLSDAEETLDEIYQEIEVINSQLHHCQPVKQSDRLVFVGLRI
jgi:hypothetical protein